MLLVSQRVEAPRMEPLLQGSVKRKLADDSSPVVNGVSDGMIPGSSKRPCLEDVTLSMGPGSGPSMSQNSPYSSSTGVGGHSGLLDGNQMNGNGMGSPFSEIKPSPGTAGHGGMLPSFDPNGNSNAPSVEQELQDILDELTKNPDPSLNELDIEKILGNKSDEQVSVGFMHPDTNGTPKRSPPRTSHLESHLTNKDFSPGFSQAPVGSPQVGPPSAGAPYSLPHPTKAVPSPMSSNSQSQTQARSPMLSAALSNRSGTNWHEVSRAQQLQQMANSKHISTPPQPPPAQASSWPTMPSSGPSPPYRAEKLPSSSPHQQPFSPATSIQSPKNAMISSMAPAPSTGPSPPYRPEKLASPALAQPPFSPQNSLLPNMAPTGGQSTQANLMPNMPSSGTRPSPPYRPDKLSSPAVQQHTYSPQNGSGSAMTSQLFKAMTSSQPSLNMLMQQQQQQQQQSQPAPQPQQQPPQQQQQPAQQAAPPPPSAMQQGLMNKGGLGQDPFSFNNTKPLSHFDPDPPPAQKVASIPGGPGQPSLTHYMPPQSSSGMPQPPSASHSQLIQQQQQQLQQRMPRALQPGGLMPLNRAEQTPGMVPRMQDPSSIPHPGQRQVQGNSSFILLKNQLMRRQLLQEKQRQLEQMNSDQMSDCQQITPFQGVGRSIPPDCGYPMSNPPANPSMLSHNTMLQNRLGMQPGPLNQASRAMPAFPGNPATKQGMYHQPSEFNMPLRPGQGMMGMGVPRQPIHSQTAARAGMPPSSFNANAMVQPHLRPSLGQQSANLPRVLVNSQMWPAQQGVPRMGSDAQMDHSLQPFPGSPMFSQQPMRTGMPNPYPHQPGAPPNQIAPGLPIRHQMQKLGSAQTSPVLSSLAAAQSMRTRGPLSAMAGMKPIPPSMAGLNQVHPSQGLAPPSYPSSSKQTGGYSGGNPGPKLPPYEFAQHQNNGAMPGQSSSEVDFIETLVGSNEDWLNNLTMIDEYLEQNS
ncbi:mastermind-like domain-containing protein 1 [Amia ocellicauda]|uniref:mastermind-like domain-containing protein 1 n=1 Tax=Amia ocellicauda TaxID=2972642 RepID=UPI003464883A|nr:MAMD1 protein [Amia calva]